MGVLHCQPWNALKLQQQTRKKITAAGRFAFYVEIQKNVFSLAGNWKDTRHQNVLVWHWEKYPTYCVQVSDWKRAAEWSWPGLRFKMCLSTPAPVYLRMTCMCVPLKRNSLRYTGWLINVQAFLSSLKALFDKNDSYFAPDTVEVDFLFTSC